MKKALAHALFATAIPTLIACAGCYQSYDISVVDEAGKPVPHAKMSFEYQENIDPSGKHGEWYREELSADANGRACWSGFVKYSPKLTSVRADGYYSSRSFDLSFGKNSICLRKIQSPTPMISEESFYLPPGAGRYEYDLLENDLLPPYGHGKHPDIAFVVGEREKPDRWGRKYFWTIEFPGEGDGIDFHWSSSEAERKSSFEGLYLAPETGYRFKTLDQCRVECLKDVYKAVDKDSFRELLFGSPDKFAKSCIENHDEEKYYRDFSVHFYFRVRTQTGRPLYGNISAASPVSGFLIRDDCTAISYNYRLNPSGGRSQEPALKSNGF